MRKQKPKITLRRRGTYTGPGAYQVEKLQNAVTVPFRNNDNPAKPFTDELRAGDKCSEATAQALVSTCEVTTLAP